MQMPTFAAPNDQLLLNNCINYICNGCFKKVEKNNLKIYIHKESFCVWARCRKCLNENLTLDSLNTN